ncbi:unnamed protein product [Caenorhabditis auriculariae]|uniref:Uncharacterized protein n=1 Tax=Caenorhabditis auriculariae TaxID=2777116 RepID=A0A8S1HHZ9_9PELO|nr:unnamed protein product [Caenorhabditis auriculariae]
MGEQPAGQRPVSGVNYLYLLGCPPSTPEPGAVPIIPRTFDTNAPGCQGCGRGAKTSIGSSDRHLYVFFVLTDASKRSASNQGKKNEASVC